jgi:GntR family transcriptional regulator
MTQAGTRSVPESAQKQLDRSSATPLHAQLAGYLRSRIRDRQLLPGTSLPSEAELQTQFGVSRSVVRQTLATLVTEGLLERGKGRATIVAAPREYHRLVQNTAGLAAQVALTGATPTTSVLSTAREDGESAAAALLGTSSTQFLERLRAVGGTPIGYIRTWLPLPACEGLTAEELTNASLHDLMFQRFGLRVTGGGRQIRAVAADEELAAKLHIAVGDPLLLLEGSSKDQHGRVVEVFSTWHRADSVAFDIDVAESTADAGEAMVTSIPHEASLQGLAEQARTLARQLELLASESENHAP